MTQHKTGWRRALASSTVAASLAVKTALALMGGSMLTGMALAAPQDPQAGREPSRLGGALQGDANARSAPMPAMTPLPAWVTPLDPALDKVLDKVLPEDSRGVDYLLVDQQTRVTASDRFNYRHRVDRIRNERGLDSSGQIEVSFNPAYQSVQIHQLRIHRQGRVLPWQQHARARWLDRETQLEKGVYDGTRTLLLTLDDLRVGDVLEYAYTVRGSNPVFGQRQFGGTELQYGVQVGQQFGRLLMPGGRDPKFQASAGVTVQRRLLPGGEQEWQWDLKDFPALQQDSGTPSWFNPYARLTWSEFEDWGAVARWASPLYELPLTPAASVQQVLNDLKHQYPTPEAQIAGALRLVQEQVRYLSVAIGAGSHAPRRPEQVLAQRFGDCKDKSLLTVALLRGLGVRAWVAFVNTELRDHLDGVLPSAGAFDHAIVLAEWNGQRYWLDPTRPPQSGTLQQLVQANFGQALVVGRGTTGLVRIPTAPSAVDRREIHARFDLRQGSGDTLYEVTTRYFGAAAEDMRQQFGSGDSRLERLQKLYLGYYARSFQGIQVAAPLEWRDDAQENVLTVVEHYRMASLWRRGRTGVTEAALSTPEMDALLQRPDLSQREHPLARKHPLRLDMTVEAQLPSEWSPLDRDAGQMQVDDEQFSFKRGYQRQGRTITLRQQYASLSDHVPAERMSEYLDHLKRADEWSGYLVKWGKNGGPVEESPAATPGTSGGRASTTTALALLAVGVLVGLLRPLRPLAVRLKLRHERHPPPNAGPEHGRPMRGAVGVVAYVPPAREEELALRATEKVDGPGRDGWRTWMHVWVGSALLMLGACLLLMWQVCRIEGDKVLLQLAHWVYGLGAIALGAWVVRSLEPWAAQQIGQWQWGRMGGRAYRAWLWRIGATDEFPGDADQDEPGSAEAASNADLAGAWGERSPTATPGQAPSRDASQTPGHAAMNAETHAAMNAPSRAPLHAASQASAQEAKLPADA